MTEEIWKDIPDYEGLYKVSSFGRFMTFKKSGWKINNINTYPNTYKCIQLQKDGIKKSFMTHRIVAQVFIPNPENKPEVNHKDLMKGNPRANNLEWVTHSENHQHAANNYPVPVIKGAYDIVGYRPRKQHSISDPVFVDERVFKSQYEALMEGNNLPLHPPRN